MLSTGRIMGWVIVAGLTLTLLNYVVKRVNRAYILKLPRESALRTGYQRFLKVIVSGHRWFALATTAALLVHFYLQYRSWGFFRSGVLAGGLLVVQGALGAYGHYVRNKRSGPWLIAHRVGAGLLLAAVVAHVLIARLN